MSLQARGKTWCRKRGSASPFWKDYSNHPDLSCQDDGSRMAGEGIHTCLETPVLWSMFWSSLLETSFKRHRNCSGSVTCVLQKNTSECHGMQLTWPKSYCALTLVHGSSKASLGDRSSQAFRCWFAKRPYHVLLSGSYQAGLTGAGRLLFLLLPSLVRKLSNLRYHQIRFRSSHWTNTYVLTSCLAFLQRCKLHHETSLQQGHSLQTITRSSRLEHCFEYSKLFEYHFKNKPAFRLLNYNCRNNNNHT